MVLILEVATRTRSKYSLPALYISIAIPLMSVVRAGTGCSGRGVEWAPPSEATSWTSSTTRTRPWTTSWVCTRRRRATTGAHPTSPNIPTSSTRWRSTTDRYGPALVSLCFVDTFFSVFDLNSVVTVQDEEAVKMLTATAGTNSKLAKPIQDLIKMIFDVESMKKAMVEFEVGFALVAQTKRVIQSSNRPMNCSFQSETLFLHSFLSAHPQIDLQKMPLGKLSKRQIQSAYALLTEVQQVSSQWLHFSFHFFFLGQGLWDATTALSSVTGRVRCLA